MHPCPSCCFPNSEQARLCGHCGLYLKPIGDYILTERIGTGGFAEVYRAANRYTGHPVAIKVLHRKLLNDKEIEQRFLREVEILRDLHSPNVVQIYDFGTIPDMGLYLVMEWLDGKTLDVFVHERNHRRLPFEEVIPLFSQLLYGLGHIHDKKVVHRDLKPKNFMVVNERGKQVLKILDFGIAWVPGAQDLTERGMFVGSTYFMAPEQFKAQKEKFGPSTDLYVAGQLLLWMLTGKHVFTANTLQALAIRHCVEQPPTMSQLCPSLPFAPELEALVAQALQKKPDHRFQSALAFLEAFRCAIPAQRALLQQSAQHQASPYRSSHGPHSSAPSYAPPQGQAAPQGQPAPTLKQAPYTGGHAAMQPQAVMQPQAAMQPQLPVMSSHRQAPSSMPPQASVGTPQSGGAGGKPSTPPQGGVLLKQRQQMTGRLTAPPLGTAYQAHIQAPSPHLIQLGEQFPARQTPMGPMQALPQQIAQHDSTPGEAGAPSLSTFRRKTTSSQRIPSISTPSAARQWLLGVAVVLGVGLLGLGIAWLLLPWLGMAPPSPL